MAIFDRFDILRMAEVRSVIDSFDRSKLFETHSLATKALESFDRTKLFETHSLETKALDSLDRQGLLETQSLAMKVVDSFDRSRLLKTQSLAAKALDSLDRQGLLETQLLAMKVVDSFDRSRLLETQSLAMKVVDSLDRSKLFENQSLATKALDSLDRLKLLEKTQSLEKISESFDKSMFLQAQAMARLMERIADPLSMDFSDILIHGNTTVSISGDIVETSSYEDKIVDVFDETSDIDEFVDQVSTWISGLKSEKLKKIASFLVLNIFVPYLVAVVATQTTPLFPNYWADVSQDVDIRVRKKSLIREISEQYPKEELEDYRIVVASSGLMVRSIGNKGGDILDGLPFGSVVLLIEKTKSWSFIEYRNENGDIIQGWVFTRYLNRF